MAPEDTDGLIGDVHFYEGGTRHIMQGHEPYEKNDWSYDALSGKKTGGIFLVWE
jgi:hypothetical protein